jgi:pimeloyl-ACP methyl ester carboxylesterase
MRTVIRVVRHLMLATAVLLCSAPADATIPAPPAPALFSPDRHIFYGEVPPNSERAPVIVFVHGLLGTAHQWWLHSDMYWSAFNARYRTAFVSMSLDNTPNSASIADNAAVLKDALAAIAAHYDASKLYLVGHSKGGLDIQAAMMYPGIADRVKAVFTIATPNRGTELADWAFGPGRDLAEKLDLLTPAVFSLRTDNMAAFRAEVDPVLRLSGVPFYTMAADRASGHPITEITGDILALLAPGQMNDGFVPLTRSRLPDDYASDLGRVSTNHFFVDAGLHSWSRIAARIQGLEYTLAEFDLVAKRGLGDEHNTFAWSMAWFKGRLYVGTGREVQCISLRTSDILSGNNLYNVSVQSGQCAPLTELHRSLGAEIWRLTPETGAWQRVYKSPESVFAGIDEQGAILTARDVGYRGMAIYRDAQGNEELWVGGVTSASIFEHMLPSPDQFPPPRILHSANGTDWAAVPQLPGTFLGDIAKSLPGSERRQRSFRAITQYKGLLLATVADYRGVGFVVASANPAAGNDAWFRVTPIPEEFPVWNLAVFNNLLYATTGDKDISNSGYGVFKTAATGPLPWTWMPVVVRGGYQPDPRLRSPNGLSMVEFKGQLYIGTNRPTELIRVRPDDSWDLLVGEPRMTPTGFKAPLSGLGIGFGSWFNGHFWRMGVHNGRLYLGTWDWSVGLRTIRSLEKPFGFQFGSDLFRSEDGVRWTAVTRSGMGEPMNFGVRTFASTPHGLYFGTARPVGGTEIYKCDNPDCRMPAPALAAPEGLEAVSEVVSGRQVILTWRPVQGAARYRVYRLTGQSIDEILPLDPAIAAPDDSAAAEPPRFVANLPNPIVQVGITVTTFHTEVAPTPMQSVYFVRAEDAQGNLSEPSNFVGGPSKAGPFVNPMP